MIVSVLVLDCTDVIAVNADREVVTVYRAMVLSVLPFLQLLVTVLFLLESIMTCARFQLILVHDFRAIIEFGGSSEIGGIVSWTP